MVHSRLPNSAVAHTPSGLSPHSSSSLKLLIRTQGTPLKSCQNVIAIRTTFLLGKIKIWCFGIRTSVSLQTNQRNSGDLLGTPLMQAGFWMLATRYALQLYYIGACTCTELPCNTVVQLFSQALKEYSRRAKPRYNQFGKCIGTLMGLFKTINLVIAQFCPQATVPIPSTSVAGIVLTQSQGVCYLASCSDLCGDTKLRSSMPTSQPTLVLLLWSVFPSQQMRYRQSRLPQRFKM